MSERWAKRILLAAAFYNVAWGAWVIAFPNLSFDWLGMPRPNYPQFWQCIGMIVGVYGVGYFLAAKDPARHWPVVFVGFLGKIFGPIGFLGAIVNATLPIGFGWHLVFNDLVWWIPFALVLKFAWENPARV